MHEWSYPFDDRPRIVKDEYGFDVKDREEPTDNVITWVFEEGTFRPTAKLTAAENYSIITDHLGTPAQMYDHWGAKTWDAELDIYGKVRSFDGGLGSYAGSLSDCPFRYQGQYEDEETGLYYNRFRYYDPDAGSYLSQDPISINGGLNIYTYVRDTNSWVDVLGLSGRGGSVHQGIQDQIAETLRGQGKSVRIEDGIELPNGRSRYGDVVVRDPQTGRVTEVHQVGDMRSRGGFRPSARERGAIMDIRRSSELAPDARIVFHDKKGRITLIDPDKSPDWKVPANKHLKGGCP